MKWEYKAVQLVNLNTSVTTLNRLLNEFGEKGWELVSVDKGIAFFMKPTEESIELTKITPLQAEFLGNQIRRLGVK